MDRFDKARAAGIDLQHDKVEYVTTCPHCSPTRRKKNVKCLSVKLSSDAILFICHHCGEKGGFFDDNSRTINGARTGATKTGIGSGTGKQARPMVAAKPKRWW